ncbi:MAG: hypothetical protein M3Y53_01905 [Thermoproteota archaeon]|nr:hypothetical protein [Thermoproteota archaeon]
MQASGNDLDICGLCNSIAILFDSDNSETVCGKCGVVLQENAESLGADWGIYSGDDIESKSSTDIAVSVSRYEAFNVHLLFKCGRKRWCDQP